MYFNLSSIDALPFGCENKFHFHVKNRLLDRSHNVEDKLNLMSSLLLREINFDLLLSFQINELCLIDKKHYTILKSIYKGKISFFKAFKY